MVVAESLNSVTDDECESRSIDPVLNECRISALMRLNLHGCNRQQEAKRNEAVLNERRRRAGKNEDSSRQDRIQGLASIQKQPARVSCTRM
jgi:hypothetical protein